MFIYIMIHLYGPTVTKLNIFAVVTNLAHCKIFSVNQPEKIWSSEAYVLLGLPSEKIRDLVATLKFSLCHTLMHLHGPSINILAWTKH